MKLLSAKIKENNCFIAVGLAHLYQKYGLIEQLKNEGFIISEIMHLQQ